jgi:hypothetical protein
MAMSAWRDRDVPLIRWPACTRYARSVSELAERTSGHASVAGATDDSHVMLIGLGYVGLPLGLSLLEAGLDVVGVDSNAARLDMLRLGAGWS